jgi:hypothetical protein
MGFHFLWFSNILNGDRHRDDRSLAIFGDMIPWFSETSQTDVFIVLLWKNS